MQDSGPLSQEPSYQNSLQQEARIQEKYKNDVKFVKVCQLLDNLQISKSTMKLKMLQAFFMKFYQGRDVYPLMRLLMPQLDRERGNYNLKETSLARMYSDILMLPKKEADRLKHWKNPQFQPIGGPTGDFIGVLQSVLLNRARNDPILSVIQINLYLDELSMATDNDTRRDVLAKMLQKTTIQQQRWIVKIILKDLKVGVGHETILKNFHPDALDLYNVTSDLGEVFKELNSASGRVRIGADRFRLFFPIKPMLADRLPSVQIRQLLQNVRVAVETKFDGERIQCHVKDGVVKFFSRNSHNYTHIYGPKMSRVVLENINAKACILDGEMVVYDFFNKSYLAFGQNKTVALADEEESRAEGKQLCYKVFDILYVQGVRGEEANLMNAILLDRKKVLSRVVNNITHVFEAVPGYQTQNLDHVFEQFNKAVAQNEEGIMVKVLDSLYRPNERSTAWLKMKADYIDELGDTLDLVIIGGYFGEGKRAGGADWVESITVFLMGIIRHADLKNPKNSEITPFTKVGTGYSIEELQTLRAKLRKNWKKYDARMPPHYYGKWTPSMSERPDVYLDDPSVSVVMELRAGEIQISDQYPVGYTLRFPRVLKIRDDKEWFEAFNQKDFQNLLANFSEHRRLKNKEKRIEDLYPEYEAAKQKKKRKKGEGLAAKRKFNPVVLPYRDTDTSNVQQISTIFAGFEFYIATLARDNPDGLTKAILQTYIVQHGGKKVQNLLPSTTHVIASHIDFQLENLILKVDPNVYHYRWILRCIKHRAVVDITPKFMVYTNQRGLDYFREHIDEYDDTYNKPLTIETIAGVFEGMDDLQAVADPMLSALNERIEICKAKQPLKEPLDLKAEDVMEPEYLGAMELENIRPLQHRVFFVYGYEKQSKNEMKLNLIINNALFFGASVVYGREKEVDWTHVTDLIDYNLSIERVRKELIERAEDEGVQVRSWIWIKETIERLMEEALLG